MNERPLYNTVLIAPYIEYLGKYYPDVDIDSILSDAGMTDYQLRDKGHWFTQRQVDLFYESLTKKTGNPNIAREVGRFVTTTSSASSIIRQYVLGFIGPASAYDMLQKIKIRELLNVSVLPGVRTRQTCF